MKENIKHIFENIAATCKASGREPGAVRVLAATKTVDPARINLLPGLGITLAGENRVQEFLGKIDFVKNIEWHFIGALQSNKVKSIVGKVTLIHSLDRLSLADEIERQSAALGIVSDVLIEINAGREPNKSGVLPAQLEALYNYVKDLKHVRVTGFMPVLPIGADEKLYAEMNGIFNEYRSRDNNITELSMGMTGDYETAILYGATVVRLGSCIFGQRK